MQLDFSTHTIIDRLIQSFPISGELSTTELIRKTFLEKFEFQLSDLRSAGSIVHFKVTFRPGNEWFPISLRKILGSKVLGLGTLAISVSWRRGMRKKIEIIGLATKKKSNMKAMKYDLSPCYKYVELKTVSKTLVKTWVDINTTALRSVYKLVRRSCCCNAGCLVPYLSGAWQWDLRFICKICGKEYYCSCFKKALELFRQRALAESSRYSRDGWPQKFLDDFERIECKDKICHLCRKKVPTLRFCHEMYCGPFEINYGPYIRKKAIEEGIDNREAANLLREELGVGWISEKRLLKLIREQFPEQKIIYQFRADWLRKQSIDIYLPGLGIAVEYQGEQHFKPISLFGGSEAYSRTIERDAAKAKLCQQHDIKLIYFRFDEHITGESVRSKIMAKAEE
jgi:hypothetical protein